MKDKFCVSKTLVYLVTLVLAIVGTFYLTNYANSQKLTSDSEAAPVACVEKGVKGIYASVEKYPTGCGVTTKTFNSLSRAYNTKFHAYNAANLKDVNGKLTTFCCIPERNPTTVPGSVVSCKSVGGTWYKTKPAGSITACSDIGQGYGNAPSTVTEKVTGSLCCVTTKLPTPTLGGKTCGQQGGDWYRSSAYYSNGFDSCQELSTLVKSPYSSPTQQASDQAYYKNYLCCVPQKVPTTSP